MIDDAGILRRLASHTSRSIDRQLRICAVKRWYVNQSASTYSSSRKFLSILDKRIATGRDHRRDDGMVR